MKILIVGTAYPYRGGLAAFNERLARQFVSEGHEVKVVTFTLQYPGFLFPGKTQFTDAPSPEGLVIERRINSCNPFNWISVGRVLRRENADIAIFAYWMSFFAPCFGTIARFLKGTRCVGLIHNMIPHEPNILDRFLPGFFVRAMDSFTSLSQSVLEDIGRFDKKNKPKSWAPHPIYDTYGEKLSKSEARRLLGLPEGGRYVLFFGFIREYKGLDLLIEAMSVLKDIKLIVAGEFYGDSKPYLDKIASLGIQDRVLLYNDYIPDGEVNRFFCACDIVAQPYRTATQSGVTQVAYHFEKPMLVTAVGGLPEIVPDGEAGFVVNPDAASIADGIRRFYDENREEAFIGGVLREKSKYSWRRMTEAILGAVEAIPNSER